MVNDAAVRTARLSRRIVALLTHSVAGPALVTGALVAAVVGGAVLLADPADDLPVPVVVDDAPLLPTDQEPAGGWAPGTRGAVTADAPAAEGDAVTDVTDEGDAVTDLTDEGDAVTDVTDTVGDLTDTVDDVTETTGSLLDDLPDAPGDVTDALDETTATLDDTVDDVLDTTDQVTGDDLDEAVDTEVPLP